jgi:DNA-binding NtrC family response regulator
MSSGRLLLVDDNPDLLETAKDVLEDAGYEIHTAVSVVSALTEQTKKPFDLMIVDLNLPDGTGLDLAAKIHESTPQTRVLLMSGEASLNVNIAPGIIYDYLVKPVDLQKLLAIIKKALGT